MAPKNCTDCVKHLRLENCSQIGVSFGESAGQGMTSIVLLVSAVILFILLILKDGVRSLRIRAHWIPGDFLVLSALTIQLLNLISTQGEPMNWQQRDITLNEFWMIHTSRIMLCVVIAYLIPAMANPGAEDFWGKILSLALTVFLHVISELYFINPKSAGSIIKSLWPRQRGTNIRLYYIFAALIFSSFCMLLLLLGCANIAGRGIERIVAKKTPLILKEQVEEDDRHHHHHAYEGVRRAEEYHLYQFRCQECWRRVEDAVLRTWIVARAYSLQYVIARSPLAASAAIIVAFQITITIVAGVRNSPELVLCTARDRLRFSITMMQCVFILIGWSMILWRWVRAVAYFGNWSSCFRMEDFWTRHLKELQQAEKNKLPQSQLLHAKIENLVVNQSTKITLPGLLLYLVIGVQWFTVSFSKACWLASQILFPKILTGKYQSKLKKGYSHYYKEILEGVQMLGETPESLWLANCPSIPKAVNIISRGKEHGQRKCEHLVEFLSTKRTHRGLGLSCLEPNKPQTGLKYLCKRTPVEGTQQPPEGMSRKQWKMTAVSLLSIIVQLSPICAETGKEHPSTSLIFPPKVAKDCLDAYSQAWEIIDFVDKADTEADDITSEAAHEITNDAADIYFGKLRKKELLPVSNSREGSTPDIVTAALAALKTESKRKTETPVIIKPAGSKSKEKTQGCPDRWNGSDSIDWSAAAWGSAVYKLCNSIECNEETDVNDLLKELEGCLADIINECLEKIQHLLILNCRKWAVKSDERKIAKALYTAGKARKIMEMLRDKTVIEEGSGSVKVPDQGKFSFNCCFSGVLCGKYEVSK